MQVRFSKWYNGYVLLKLKSEKSERFINLCRNRKILIWNIKKYEDDVCFCIKASDVKKTSYIIRKVGTVPKITKKVGLPFVIFKYRNRWAFILGFMLCVFVLYISSLFVWDIQIKGQSLHTESALIKYLESIDVYNGMKISSVKCQYIEECIRKEYKDIGWVSAQITGTKLIIKIEENNIITRKNETETCGHLVADADGIVTYVLVRSGTPIVKPGSEVKKGDVLVSGVVEIFDDSGSCIEKNKCKADADVYIKREIDYYDELLIEFEEKEYTGKRKKDIKISLKNDYLLFKSLKKFDNYDIIENVHCVNIIENFVLPVQIYIKEYRQYSPIKKEYDKESASNILLKEFDRFCKKNIEDNIEIVDNNINISYNNGKAFCKGVLTIIEKADVYTDISEDELIIEYNDEHIQAE